MNRHSVWICVIAVLCSASAGCGQSTVSLSLPAEVKGRPAEFVSVSATTPGKSVQWLSADDGLRVLSPALLKDTKTAVVVAARPGRYRLFAVTCAADVLSDVAACTVVIEDGPPTGVDARADHAPAKPQAGCCWLVVIEETAERTPSQAALLGDAELSGYVRCKGWRVRVADRDAKDAEGRVPRDLAGYIERAKGKRLPYLILVDASGKARHEGTMPASAAEVLATLKKAGG